MNPSNAQHALEQIIGPELEQDERLLWTGRPAQGIVFRLQDILLIPFSFMWCGFALYWEFSVFSLMHGPGSKAQDIPLGVDIVFPLFGIPFCIVGLYIAFGRFFVDIQRRKKRYYAVTDRRIISISKFLRYSVDSYDLNGLKDLKLRLSKNGTGTIILKDRGFFHLMAGWDVWFPSGKDRLEKINNAREVYSLINKHRHG